MNELKPCPFCAGNALELRTVGDRGELCSVMCECGGETDYHQRDWGAINQWNNRPAEDTLTEHLRLKEEECKELASDKVELAALLVSIEEYLGFMEGDFAYNEELHNRAKTLLEKHQC